MVKLHSNEDKTCHSYDRVSIRFVVCQTFSTISVFVQDEVYNSERIWEKLCNLVAKKCYCSCVDMAVLW
jgi:hypothetical protein